MMTDIEYIEVTKSLIGDDPLMDDLALSYYIRLAKNAVLSRIYPFDKAKTEVPERYEERVCEIASYFWNKRGAEGETAHNENGISRTYEASDIPPSMLYGILPYCGVVK